MGNLIRWAMIVSLVASLMTMYWIVTDGTQTMNPDTQFTIRLAGVFVGFAYLYAIVQLYRGIR